MKLSVKRDGHTFRVTGAAVDIKYLVLGPIENNTFIISDDTTTFVVDPSDNASAIVKALGSKRLDAIVVTHHHADHTSALADLKAMTNAPVYASAIDAPVIENQPAGEFPPTKSYMVWRVIATPGHTPGGICLFLESDSGKYLDGANVLIAGDTLFCASIGRTDFPGGNAKQMRASLRKLSQLPDETLVLTGHNSLTTIGDEQRRVFAYYC